MMANRPPGYPDFEQDPHGGTVDAEKSLVEFEAKDEVRGSQPEYS